MYTYKRVFVPQQVLSWAGDESEVGRSLAIGEDGLGRASLQFVRAGDQGAIDAGGQGGVTRGAVLEGLLLMGGHPFEKRRKHFVMAGYFDRDEKTAAGE